METKPDPIDVFREELQQALRGTRRKQDDLARNLSRPLWVIACRTRARRSGPQPDWRDHARRCGDWADEIAKHADKLIQLLDPRNLARRLEDARFYFRPLPHRFETFGDIANAVSGPLDWPAATQAHPTLVSLAQEARMVASKARKDERLPKDKGRPLDRGRIALSAEVAFCLWVEGVDPTTTKAGVFTRVLSVVQAAAGFGRRPAENLQEDARRALREGQMALVRRWRSEDPVRA